MGAYNGRNVLGVRGVAVGLNTIGRIEMPRERERERRRKGLLDLRPNGKHEKHEVSGVVP